MSSTTKTTLIEAVGRLVQLFQNSSQKFDAEVGRLYDLNSAELHCLSFLWPNPQPANAIAREVRLTPAAVTALIDRLERRGYVRREADPNDRRKVMVSATQKTAELTAATYLIVAEAGAKMLGKFSNAELETLSRLLENAVAVQEEVTGQLSSLDPQLPDGNTSGRRRAGTGSLPLRNQ